MERWGIIGGTFDPIHLAHIYIASKAKEELSLDKVIFMPAGSPPHKIEKRITEASLRFKMVKVAIEGMEGFEVSDYEIKKQGKSYTYKTLEDYYDKNREIYFITGADCLINLEKWKNVQRILDLCTLVVLNRPGINNEELYSQKKYIENKYNSQIKVLEIEGKDISSTEIREMIKVNSKIEEYVPIRVLNIIKEEKLYGVR